MKAFENKNTMLSLISIFIMVINIIGLIVKQETVVIDLLNIGIGFFLFQLMVVERKLKKEETQKEV